MSTATAQTPGTQSEFLHLVSFLLMMEVPAFGTSDKPSLTKLIICRSLKVVVMVINTLQGLLSYLYGQVAMT